MIESCVVCGKLKRSVIAARLMDHKQHFVCLFISVPEVKILPLLGEVLNHVLNAMVTAVCVCVLCKTPLNLSG